jgi:hypothetical protein
VTILGRPSFVDGGQQPIIRYAGGTPVAAGEWGGTHALHGILALRGKAFRQGETVTPMAIIDLAPTLLYLLGIPIPADMDGRVLKAAFTEEFQGVHAVLRQDAGHEPGADGNARPPRDTTYSEAESLYVEARLRSLGYIE